MKAIFDQLLTSFMYPIFNIRLRVDQELCGRRAKFEHEVPCLTGSGTRGRLHLEEVAEAAQDGVEASIGTLRDLDTAELVQVTTRVGDE